MRIELYNSRNLNFVEFNITGDNENYIRCAPESFFLDTEVFNLFANCFENSNKLYEYFGATRYNLRAILPLQNNLQESLSTLKYTRSSDDFITFIHHAFLGNNFIMQISKHDKMWEQNWEIYVKKLVLVNQELINLIDRCVEEERVLWVIGY